MKLTQVVGFVLALLFCVATAHEVRVVGEYRFVVGFLNEPTFAGFLNSIDLRVSVNATGTPVSGLESTVQASVIYGSNAAHALSVETGSAVGSYVGYFIPSKSGNYNFTVTGNILGASINEVFATSAGKFGPVREVSSLRFPPTSSATTLAPTLLAVVIALVYLL